MGSETKTTTADVRDLLVHAEWLRHLAGRLVDEAEADDVVQETFMAAMRRPPQTGDGGPRPWLMKVLRNLAARRWRRQGAQQRVQRALAETETPEAPAAEEVIARGHLQRRLADLVLQLEEPYRSTVLLRYYEGKSAADIARALGLPAGTVRWRLSEGLERLRKRLDEEHGTRQRWRALLLPLCLPRAPKPVPPGAAGATSVGLRTATAVLAGVTIVSAAIAVVVGQRDRGFDVAAARPALRAQVNLDQGAPAAKAAITGRVTTPDGRPASGAIVTLARAPSPGETMLTPRPSGTARTDGDGRFGFEDAWPGTYRLSASAPGFAAALSPVFGVTAGAPSAHQLRLGEGGSTLSGQVLDEGGGPLPGARVVVSLAYPWVMTTSPTHPARLFETTADNEGRYQLTLEPREYGLEISAGGYAPAQTTVALNRSVTRDVRLSPAARLFGRVIERATGRPLAGAAVRLSAADDRRGRLPAEIRSDEEGRFGFDDVSAGAYQVQVRHRERNLVGSGPVVMAIATEAVTGLEVALDPGAVLTGRVVDEGGQALPGVEVTLGPAGNFSGSSPFDFARLFTTSGGAFTLSGLLPGGYQLWAKGGDGARSDAVVEVGPEGKAGVLLQMARAGLDAAVAGRVLDPTGRPVAGVLVRNEHRASRSNAVESAEDGRFRLTGVGNEAPTLLAWHPHHGLARATLPPVGPGQTTTVELQLQPGAAIGGRVTFEDGAPAPDISVAVTRQDGTVIYDSTTTGLDGAFFIANLADGLYTVNATRRAGPFNLSTSRESPALKLISIGPGEQRRDLALLVKRGGRTITGIVVDNNDFPAPGIQVIANTDEGDRSWKPNGHRVVFRATSTEDGRFRIEDVEDELYALWATRPGSPDGILKGVRPGSSDVRLVLPAAATVSGVAVAGDGRPVTDFSVHVLPAVAPDAPRAQQIRRIEAGRLPPTVVRDPGGAFRVGGLEAGRYEVKVAAGEGGASETVSLTSGENKSGLRLIISAGVKATGRVVRLADGSPLPGLEVSAQLARSRRINTKTREDGTFELGGLLPGEELSLNVRDHSNTLVGEWLETKVPDGTSVVDLGTFKLMAGDTGRLQWERGTTGLRPKVDGKQIHLVDVPADSPAARAGVRAGDVLLAVGDRKVSGLGQGAISYLLWRKPGESLTVVLQTPGSERRRITLTADKAKAN